MQTEVKGIVIIGNGIAGLSAAEAARKQDENIPITIISNEKYLTYYRLRLCEFIGKALDSNSLNVHPLSWYEDRNIEVLLNKTVMLVNAAEKLIQLHDGLQLSYHKLIIASGSFSFIPPVADTPQNVIMSLWNMDDVYGLNDEVEHIRHAAIVGGGLLGLEAAYHMNKQGIKTTIIEFMPRLLPNQLDEHGSRIFASKVKSLGIDIITGSTVQSIIGTERVEKVVLNTGKIIDAQLVFSAAGVRPNLSMVKSTHVNINKRIIVDQFMRTSDADIYAAGDVAEYNNKWLGLWSAAMSQGKIAGTNAAGGQMEYKLETPPYFLNSMDTKIFSIGDIGRDMSSAYETIQCVNEEDYLYQKLFFKNNKIMGAILIGDTKNSNKISIAIKNGMTKNECQDLISEYE
ncbi:FAD-dependent oxidoreductase [Petroclostridium sp. X23]|uniref:NAD(P)/FAD-dependent oxidoreductase n=1 Tax=Petroclostridium sp. X23 TaxID=3045146 RepID=UPI0024ADEDAC|nr:FAD-dependent oxidoreductase [Petroclostridium sp. X23]WHH57510.1 FAD-dependent oxidoreductase [Petroclostridium sp. X23]